MSRPRLRHVAEIAGVSEATVSRVVNAREGVADETKRRVQQALSQLGYEPVGLGRVKRTGLVGLIVPELDNPIFPAFAQAIEYQLSARGLTMVMCTSSPSGMQEGEYIDVLLDHQVSGIVFVSGRHADTAADHDRYRELAALGMPMVLVNGRPDDLADLPAIAADDRYAMRTAVGHLAALGHDRIGLIAGPRRYVPSSRKIAGYLEGLEEAGLPADEDLLTETVYSVEGGHAAALHLLDQEATALICASDSMAVGALRSAREAGLVVPTDLSIVGFDDSLLAAAVVPALTTCRQPIRGMVREIAAKLGDQIQGREVNLAEFLFRTDLIVRQSSGPVPA